MNQASQRRHYFTPSDPKKQIKEDSYVFSSWLINFLGLNEGVLYLPPASDAIIEIINIIISIIRLINTGNILLALFLDIISGSIVTIVKKQSSRNSWVWYHRDIHLQFSPGPRTFLMRLLLGGRLYWGAAGRNPAQGASAQQRACTQWCARSSGVIKQQFEVI